MAAASLSKIPYYYRNPLPERSYTERRPELSPSQNHNGEEIRGASSCIRMVVSYRFRWSGAWGRVNGMLHGGCSVVLLRFMVCSA